MKSLAQREYWILEHTWAGRMACSLSHDSKARSLYSPSSWKPGSSSPLEMRLSAHRVYQRAQWPHAEMSAHTVLIGCLAAEGNLSFPEASCIGSHTQEARKGRLPPTMSRRSQVSVQLQKG